jgi:hypothetical protein
VVEFSIFAKVGRPLWHSPSSVLASAIEISRITGEMGKWGKMKRVKRGNGEKEKL